MIIIGITGTLGAGKGTIVEHLKQRGFNHYSVREFLIREIKKRGLPVNRESMTDVANDLRKNHHPAYIIEQLYNIAKEKGANAVIESIRTPGEIYFLRDKENFYLFAVDADPEIRYQRIKQRASETDHVSFETFLANEQREMHTDDPNKQNLAKCIELADYKFDNNGDMESLFAAVDKVIREIEKSKE